MLKVKHYIEYLFYIAASAVLKNIPRGAGYWLMRRFGDFVFYVVQARRKVALANIRIAFGTVKTESEIRALARKVYQNFAMTAMDVVRLPELSLEKIKEITSLEGKEYLDNSRARGKGTVMITGHLGFWDITGLRILAEGYPMTYVSGGFRNLMIDKLYNWFREQRGIKVLPRQYALRGVLKSLARNELIGIVSDQNAGTNGVFVDFFGKKASTPIGAARFALKSGASIVMVLNVPDADRKHYRALVIPVEINKTGDEEKDTLLYTERFTKILEDVVRQHPEHYFWLHRRWKTRPPEER
jgi:Kdo2-lipid IVA lauroyltransferase/acyltransferase